MSYKIDIDGPNKGKTQYGSDIFDFSINTTKDTGYENVLIPATNPSSWIGPLKENYLTAWVIRYDNLDYLKNDYKCTDGEYLFWETKTRCK